jgi:NAD(P)H-nitrite reductase large subunit
MRWHNDRAEMTNACLICESCEKERDVILNSVCGCKSVSKATVLEAIKNSADTVEKVGELTGA